jgi:hypothetical protein
VAVQKLRLSKGQDRAIRAIAANGGTLRRLPDSANNFDVWEIGATDETHGIRVSRTVINGLKEKGLITTHGLNSATITMKGKRVAKYLLLERVHG